MTHGIAYKAPLIGISRLRMGTDGNGITTLVAFGGCRLRCRYCLNPQCHSEVKIWKTPEDVMKVLQKDELYFWATRGGVTFGGGEPLLYPQFIQTVLELGAKQWHVTVETSMNVSQESLEVLLPYVDEYIVDVKDMDPLIYQKYTSRSNKYVKNNLRWLISHGKKDNIFVRVPLIQGYNDANAQDSSIEELSSMGLTRFDRFEYK
jgi:pyruvate formate lyase activating enzyme